jgi:hypothetical protein
MSQYYEHYRQSTLGRTLTEALDDLISNGQLSPQLGVRVLTQASSFYYSNKENTNQSFSLIKV